MAIPAGEIVRSRCRRRRRRGNGGVDSRNKSARNRTVTPLLSLYTNGSVFTGAAAKSYHRHPELCPPIGGMPEHANYLQRVFSDVALEESRAVVTTAEYDANLKAGPPVRGTSKEWQKMTSKRKKLRLMA